MQMASRKKGRLFAGRPMVNCTYELGGEAAGAIFRTRDFVIGSLAGGTAGPQVRLTAPARAARLKNVFRIAPAAASAVRRSSQPLCALKQLFSLPQQLPAIAERVAQPGIPLRELGRFPVFARHSTSQARGRRTLKTAPSCRAHAWAGN